MTSLSRAAAMRGASIITGINVLVASGFSLAGLVSPQSVLRGAAARTIPLALFALVAIYDDRESNFRSVATAWEAPRPYGYPKFCIHNTHRGQEPG